MRENLAIFGCLALGLVAGMTGTAPAVLAAPGLPLVLLSGLVFLVGITLGGNREVLASLRRLRWQMLLLANIVREMVALFGLPWFARFGGRLAPISVAGINSMDVCLPMIVRNSGSEFIPLAVLHGVALEVSVPVLISLFCR